MFWGQVILTISKGKYAQTLLSFLFVFLGPHLRNMEVPRRGVELELQLPAYATAMAAQDPSLACNLHHSSQQHQILNPASEAKGPTHILVDTSQAPYC